jgi:REP element-mobilizing transposase RayT
MVVPRKPRHEQPGGIHHVFARGVERRLIFLGEADYAHYLNQLGRVTRRQGWNLLIETPDPNLGRGIQRLHGLYAAGFNERYERTGHLFERRYGNVPIRDDAQLLTATTYIALNPVKAELCRQPQDWPWSSHAAMFSGQVPPWLASERLTELFSEPAAAPLAAYAAAIDRRTGV